MKKTIVITTLLFCFFLLTCSDSDKNAASKPADLEQHTEKGIRIAQATQAHLGQNLMQAIKRNGPEGALEFCKLQAYPLTDSMANVQKVQIKRVSDKARNPKNKASKHELALIDAYKKKLAKNQPFKATIETKKNKVKFFYPILTSQLCLQCHGKPDSDIAEATLSKINSLYPEDEAKGYAANEIRGIWRIEWEE